MAQQEFAWVAGLLDRASYDERAGRMLHMVLAELGQLCGWSAGDHGLAQRYYVAALRAAHSADDRPRGRATPALLAELHIRHAEALGTLRDTSGCTAAISQAHAQVEQLKPDDEPPWLYWMDRAAITVDAGECLLRLGQPDQAVAMLHPGFTPGSWPSP